MIASVLSRTPLTWLPLVALCIFVTVFVGALIWVFLPSRRAVHERMARLVLDK